MILNVVFRRAARAEFDRAALWYEERQPGLGLQFTAEIDRAVDRNSDDPVRTIHPRRRTQNLILALAHLLDGSISIFSIAW